MADGYSLGDVRIPQELGSEVLKAVMAKGIKVREDEKDTKERDFALWPKAPVIAFVNGRSGGRLGPDLLRILTELLTPVQVYDLASAKPNVVLPAITECLEQLMEGGNETAKTVRQNLRLFVAGGDGTVGWLLSVVEPMESPPPIAVIPLGTGNDLSRSFGWGPTFSLATSDRVERRLLAGAVAQVCNLDSWNIKLTPSPDMDASQLKLPYALHKTSTDLEAGTSTTEFVGNFYNYFSIGMDAQVAYAFHHLRDTRPGVARGPRVNQMIYGMYGCTQGWMCATCTPGEQAQARCLHMVANIQVQKEENGPYIDLVLDNSLRAVMILNLQSYAGGRDPWGKPSTELEGQNGWTPARPDDGKLEVLGLRDGIHSLLMLTKLQGGKRLCQAYGVRIELRGEHRNRAYLQLDGEPWEQRLSADGREPTVVEITRKPRPSLMCREAAAMVADSL